MKKTLITITLFLTVVNFGFSQITFDTDYEYSGAYVELAQSGYKFYIMDVVTNQCRIYNTDHSLWKTINLPVPSDKYLYDIRYVSENLFTDDNSVSLCYFYYYYNDIAQYYTYYAKIINEDGTELLTLTGAQYAYVYNIDDENTKLIAYLYDYSVVPYTITTVIYDLPGQLLSTKRGNDFPQLTGQAYPNPSTTFTILPYSLPEGINSGELQISDMQGRVVKTFGVDRSFDNFRINTAEFPKGTYLYRLVSGNYVSGANKLIVK